MSIVLIQNAVGTNCYRFNHPELADRFAKQLTFGETSFVFGPESTVAIASYSYKAS